MSTKFKKDQQVKAKVVVPQGPVSALRMDEDGNFFYRIEWTDDKGRQHSRWFAEESLVEA